MVISIVKTMTPGLTNYLIDKGLAIDSLLFMISALLSFSSIRVEQSAGALGGNDIFAWLGVNDTDYCHILF